jgi:hypothetical protein
MSPKISRRAIARGWNGVTNAPKEASNCRARARTVGEIAENSIEPVDDASAAPPGLGSISTKTLTERLRMLEAEGRIHRHYEPTVPPQVTYSLAKRVLELDPVMMELDRIAERWYGSGKRR